MNENNTLSLTEFDIATGASALQMIKAYLPFMDTAKQRKISMIIRLIELINTVSFYDSLSISPLCRECHDSEHIISEIRRYCSAKDQEIFQMMENFKNMSSMYDMYKNMSSFNQDAPENGNDFMKSFLNKEQQDKFEQYKSLLNI